MAPAVAGSARYYTRAEELANSLTHGVGLLLSSLGLVLLMAATGPDAGLRVVGSCLVYGVSLITLYAVSTLYHGITLPAPKRVLRTLDHLAILLLIAGTYTPFVLIALRGVWGWTLFGLIWVLAALGVLLEMTRLGRSRRAMIALYLCMGWVGLIAFKPLLAALPANGLWLLFGGGACYSLGVVFYRWHGLPFHHAFWHLFVLAGSIAQFLAVLWYVLPGS